MHKTFPQHLLRWYNRHKRDLPWRRTKDPYRIWVSEMMLQQTTVNAVIPYYQRWFKEFPTLADLASADLQKVLKVWQGLGYYSRARNLHKAARIVGMQHGGVLPKDPQLVRALPGFGPYSTGSVLSIAYDMPIPIVDANVRRVVMRLKALPGPAAARLDQVMLQQLNQVLPRRRAGDFNQALMELGALVCRSQQPLCRQCPVQRFCLAYERGIQDQIPERRQKVVQNIQAAIGILCHKGRFLIQQRPAKGLMAELWEFPGGKLEPGETPAEALMREIKEELDVALESAEAVFEVTHAYTQFKVRLHCFMCTPKTLPKLNKSRRWVTLQECSQYPMPSGSVQIIELLKKRLK